MAAISWLGQGWMVAGHWMGRLGVLALMGCTLGGPPAIDGPVTAPEFDAALTLTAPEPGPGACWHGMERPALFETVTEQILVSAEQRDAAGAVTVPATFRTETRQSQLRPRQSVWFRVPCPSEGAEGVRFVASVQRALKARGLYGGAVTGEMDDATVAAVRRYQLSNGLDSPVLSLAAAQALGLAAVSP